FQAIAKQTQSGGDTVALADYYLISNRRGDARTVLTQLATDPKYYALATLRLAVIDAIEGDRAKAHAKGRQAKQKYPKEMSARLLDARLYLADGKRDDALAKATSIVTDEPNASQTSDAYLMIGAINASLDRFDDATKAYQEVLKRQRSPLVADL